MSMTKENERELYRLMWGRDMDDDLKQLVNVYGCKDCKEQGKKIVLFSSKKCEHEAALPK